jgi:hypothetical protein
MVLATARPRSRRELLAGAAGGVLALVASAIGRPLPARAADGQAVLVGGEYTSTSVTKITNGTPRDASLPLEASSGDAIQGDSSSGIAIRGVSGSYVGVWGESTSLIGVRGVSASGTGIAGSSTSGAGVIGASSAAVGVSGQGRTVGVLGNSAAGVAVRAETVSGFGVYGRADSGTGLYGSSSTGYALRTSGRLRFDKATGFATVAAGTKSIVVTPGFDLARSAKVLATLQGNAGGLTTIHRVAINATAGTFTVYLTANARRAVNVAYLVLG